jgi:cell division protein FtsI (penicillin-binding protein 3)
MKVPPREFRADHEDTMKKTAGRQVRRRIFGVVICLALACGAITTRFFYLQVIDHQRLPSRAASQIYEEVHFTPKRGDISDRHGRKLAVDVEVNSIFGVPSKVENPRQVARALSRATGIRESQFLRALRKERGFVWLRRQVVPSVTEEIRNLGLPGIGFIKENRRYYPHRELAAQVLGLAGVDNQGLEGVELYHDAYLWRDAVWLVVERDARGNDILVTGPPVETLRKGKEIRLTLDEVIQFTAQEELARGVKESGARGGAVVVLDPRTGEILAMANVPYFNPNDFQSFGPKYFRNRSISDLVEPGSIFKIFLLASALEEGVVSLRSLFFCENGAMPFKGRILHDAHPFGYLDTAGVIIHSSNIGATKIAQKLGPERYYHYLKEFGFGEKTGVDLPGEVRGLVRPVAEWSGLSISAVAIGQELSVTPLQAAAAFAAAINGGLLYRPYITREILTPDGKAARRFSPSLVRRVISPETSRRVVDTLVRAVSEGTGREAAVEGYVVAGKTGTAQKFEGAQKRYSSERYLASFVGLAPVPDPRLVVLVTIDEPRESIWGGEVAAPVFRRLLQRVLRYLNVPTNDGGQTLMVKAS